MCEIADVVHHDGDTSKAARAPTSRRWPFIEMHVPGLHDLEKLQAREPPRQIKTHVTANFFAKQVGTLLISGVILRQMRHLPNSCMLSQH